MNLQPVVIDCLYQTEHIPDEPERWDEARRHVLLRYLSGCLSNSMAARTRAAVPSALRRQDQLVLDDLIHAHARVRQRMNVRER